MTSWIPLLLGLVIKVGVETVILAIALWIMIKLQKLNYHVLGLLGAAALTSALDEILSLVLGHFLGDYLASYISTPIVVGVLFFCIAKLTEADHVDVFFTIGVGYAIWFVLNLWLLGALMGDLRPSHFAENNQKAMETESEPAETNLTEEAVAPTNHPVAHGAAAAQPAAPAPAAARTVKGFSLKGIIAGSKPSAMISTGSKTYTLFQGDSLLMETAGGNVTVHCDQLTQDRVTLNVGGETVTLALPGAKPQVVTGSHP